MPSVAGRARSFVKRHGRPVTLRTTVVTRDPNSDWDEETRVDHTTEVYAIIATPGAASTRYSPVVTRTDADRVLFIRDDTGFPMKEPEDGEPTAVTVDDGHEYNLQLLAADGNGLLRLEVGHE